MWLGRPYVVGGGDERRSGVFQHPAKGSGHGADNVRENNGWLKIDASFAFPEIVVPQRVGTSGPSPTQNQGKKVGLFPNEVQFSVDREKVQRLKSDLDGLPDLRQERVAVLRQAIEAGSYKVPSQQIAQAMCSDLLGKE
jgi:flagellar biosynthesis anti-sigma factor FlgM